MKQSSIRGLREPIWVDVPNDPLKVQVVPGEFVSILGLKTREDRDALCERFFINFSGYFDDDGEQIENTYANRCDLASFQPVFAAMIQAVSDAQVGALEGEDDAA